MTGLRLEKHKLLEWADLDFKMKQSELKNQCFIKCTRILLYRAKTRASIRTIALDDDLIKLLKEWKEKQDSNGGSKYVLSYNGLPTNKHTLRHVIKRHSNLANVHHIKIHALRHSHASLLISLESMLWT